MTDLPAMRQPKQDRSRVALERLMAASREILHEGTFELLTIAEISKRSGVSVGSIYARFGGKEDLFIAVMMEVMQELDAEWQQLIQQSAVLGTGGRCQNHIGIGRRRRRLGCRSRLCAAAGKSNQDNQQA